MILFLVVYIHAYACIWWLLVKTDKIWIPPKDQPYPNYFRVYDLPTISKYLYSFQVSVWSVNGNDFQPRDMIQVTFASFGLFMGAVIQANIFGELALILAGMNLDELVFQEKITRANTLMITLGLPFSMQQEVRHKLKMADPSR